jgi:LysR family hydrogen peroxide-inducible transcriptional activator
MDLQQLRHFLAVAREGSFVRAAQAEGITQPAISQHIAKLESELGAPVFARMGRNVRLTALGSELVGRAEAILQEAARMRRAAKAARDAECGRVTVGVIPTLLPYFFGPLQRDFTRRHPQIQLAIVEEQTAGLIDLLRSAEIDVAVLALPVKNQEIVCSELFREELVLIAPPGTKLSGPVDVQKLRGEKLLLLKEGNCLRENVLMACGRARAEFEQVFETDQLASIFSLVAAGYGMSLVPALAAPFHSGFVSLPLKQAVYRRVGYAQAKGNRASGARRTFLSWLRKAAAKSR